MSAADGEEGRILRISSTSGRADPCGDVSSKNEMNAFTALAGAGSKYEEANRLSGIETTSDNRDDEELREDTVEGEKLSEGGDQRRAVDGARGRAGEGAEDTREEEEEKESKEETTREKEREVEEERLHGSAGEIVREEGRDSYLVLPSGAYTLYAERGESTGKKLFAVLDGSTTGSNPSRARSG